MIAKSVKFRGYGCFKNEWSGFDAVKPINVIIGRNNSGKSHLLDLVSALCGNNLISINWPLKCSGTLDEESLKRYFRENTSGGDLQGNHWVDHGRHFVGVQLSWEVNVPKTHCQPIFPEGFEFRSPYGQASTRDRISLLSQVLQESWHQLSGKKFRRLLADRDIHSESADKAMMSGRFEWEPQIHKIVEIIRSWNS